MPNLVSHKVFNTVTHTIAGALVFVGFSGVTACAWVAPNVDSQWVALVKPQAVMGCRQIGETTSKTVSKVVLVNRSDVKQQNELITLAKNQAAVMAGDTIVAKSPMQDGEQTFKVYDCD